jgi:hypothetical protein
LVAVVRLNANTINRFMVMCQQKIAKNPKKDFAGRKLGKALTNEAMRAPGL